MASDSQFALLAQRRFGPLFITQFLGAFNDNVFRNALVTLIAFYTAGLSSADSNTLINICAGLFILPFFLFSATAGQFADKYEKSQLIRAVKILEILVMLAAFIGFYTGNVYWLVALLFMMGTQSTLFGPLKFGILPQHLHETELVGGNGLIEMGTHLAILLGMMLGIWLIGMQNGAIVVAIAVLLIAVLGYLASRGIPIAAPVAPDLKINWNVWTETGRNIALTRRNLVVFRSILGISWFWFLGLIYTTQLPNYTKLVLSGDDSVFMLLLTLFSLGIGVGSLLCERLSGHRVEIGLVPFGSIGLTIFGIDLFFAAANTQAGDTIISAGQFLSQSGSWRVAIDIIMIGVFGGFFIVPLYALIQQRSEPSERSRVIAGNNIINAFFMVLATLTAILLLRAGLTIPQLFLVMAIMNAAVAIYIYTLVPEFLMRFWVWMLIHTVYRVDKEGLENIPEDGPVVLVCNHVSFADALIIAGCVRRPARFVMDHRIFQTPGLNFIFRTAGTIPIASAKDNPELLEQAFQRISEYLRDDEVVCIFPEGQITRDGEINTFRSGIERILDTDPVPVVPMALCGLWGSFFSRRYGAAMGHMPRRFWSKIALKVGQPIAAQPIAAQPIAAQPIAAQPIAAQPIAAQPIAAQPIAAQPIAAQPIAAQPIAAQPIAAQPIAASEVSAALLQEKVTALRGDWQ